MTTEETAELVRATSLTVRKPLIKSEFQNIGGDMNPAITCMIWNHLTGQNTDKHAQARYIAMLKSDGRLDKRVTEIALFDGTNCLCKYTLPNE
jgi:hypothetical protein